ncbi:MAG TPA: hypothetical protein VIT65_18130 [Microlunatus sp.]
MAEQTHEPTSNDDDPKDERNNSEEQSEGQVSEGPSGFGGDETSAGGADAVPDTPDINPGTSAPIRDSHG